MPARREVSIPFIAGQWSLRRAPLPPPMLWHRLNPLHCGAVVASRRTAAPGAPLCVSQSPSLRGSGRFTATRRTPTATRRTSQSPSLRGSGRFRRGSAAWFAAEAVSIPFIAGQWSLRMAGGRGLGVASRSFNPLHCGAVVASRISPPSREGGGRVSIPFIAGQWSLLARGAAGGTGGGARFNPLHCGAVVASS